VLPASVSPGERRDLARSRGCVAGSGRCERQTPGSPAGG